MSWGLSRGASVKVSKKIATFGSTRVGAAEGCDPLIFYTVATMNIRLNGNNVRPSVSGG
ncbi:hypothetical protein ABH906_002894 [Pseudomonas frederiksbergensis]